MWNDANQFMGEDKNTVRTKMRQGRKGNYRSILSVKLDGKILDKLSLS